jgi:hypothetical protein
VFWCAIQNTWAVQPFGLARCCLHGLSWVDSTHFLSLSSIEFHIIVITNILWSPLQFKLHSQIFIHCPLMDSLKGIRPSYTLPGLPDFPLKSQWNPPWLRTLVLYVHAWKGNIIWFVPRYATSSHSIQDFLTTSVAISEFLEDAAEKILP